LKRSPAPFSFQHAPAAWVLSTLKRALVSSRFNTEQVSSYHLRIETVQVSETLCPLIFIIQKRDKVKNHSNSEYKRLSQTL
jgi:hypothetical protein